jgi:type II secretory pathway component PulC
MSDRVVTRRTQRVAIGLAAVAVALAASAVIVVVTRDRGAVPESSAPVVAPVVAPAAVPLVEHRVAAADVVALRRGAVSVAVEDGETQGLRVDDAELADRLGLRPGDVLTALSGQALTAEHELSRAITLGGSPTMIYVDILRGGQPVLLRWRLDGDLRAARLGSIPRSPPSSSAPPSDHDDLIQTIEKLDELTYRVPRKSLDKVLANPTGFTGSARIVPHVSNGQVVGFKLYAIRPSSLLHAIGLHNGDSVTAINGHAIASMDDALAAFVALQGTSRVTIELVRRGRPLALTITITP